MPYDVTFREVEAQTITSVRRRVTASDLRPYIDQSIAKMRGLLRDAGIPEAGAPFAIYHEKIAADRDGDVEVCVPCAASVLDEDVIERRTLPAARVATTAVPAASAHYPEILEAYDAVAARILHDGFLLGESPREIFDTDGIRVAWPIGGQAEATHAHITS